MLVVIGIGLLSLGGCGGDNDGVTTHPVEERIPYHDREAIQITKDQTIDGLSDPPSSLRVLASWLREPQAIDTTHLGFFVDHPGVFASFGVVSVGDDRVLLLDGKNRLFEHSVQTGETRQLARKGEGPGELKGAYDLMQDGSSVYV